MSRINLGAGSQPEPGWVNLDAMQLPGIDVVHDLDVYPWPFKDESAEEIRAFDVYEHVWHPLPFMRECWRVLQPGGILNMHVVAWDSPNYHRDPDHKRGLDPESLDYWVPGTYLHGRYGAAYARGCTFEKVSVRMDGTDLAFLLKRLP